MDTLVHKIGTPLARGTSQTFYSWNSWICAPQAQPYAQRAQLRRLSQARRHADTCV